MMGAVMGDMWSYHADVTPGAVSEVLWSESHGRCLLLRSCTFSFLAVAPGWGWGTPQSLSKATRGHGRRP